MDRGYFQALPSFALMAPMMGKTIATIERGIKRKIPIRRNTRMKQMTE